MIASNRAVLGTLAGDVQMSFRFAAAENDASPGSEVAYALSSGDNTVVVPTGATALSVLKSASNTVALVLKGASGDTGVKLHLTDPDSISLDPTQASLHLNAASAVTVRLLWT